MSRPAQQRQRGVALIVAVLVVALATVLIAALLDSGAASRARARNTLRGEQTWQLMHGLEDYAALQLERDRTAGVDSPNDPWHASAVPLEIPGGRLLGRLQAGNGCFNLNSLLLDTDSRRVAYPRFVRLLERLGLSTAIAAQALDWVDPNGEPATGGAEDLAYAQRQPPMRAGNRAFAHVSELRLLPAVDARAYDALAPYVCALPKEATTNWNFAPPLLWQSLDDAISDSKARELARDGRADYGSLDDLRAALQRSVGEPAAAALNGVYDGVATDWFTLEAEIVVDRIPYAYASRLYRDSQRGAVQVVARTRGRL